MTANRLVALGAPKLPEGHFYRVRTRFGVPWVQVRRTRRFGSTLLGESTVFAEDWETAEQAVVRVAKWAVIRAGQNERDSAITDLLGDHR